MSIPSDSLWRGCAANFPQPVDEEDVLAAQNLVETVDHFNSRLVDIIYRSSDGEEDVSRHVFRWDSTPYQQVFENGFQARRQEGTPDSTYFDLNHYMHHGGRPLDSTRPATHAFVSTTLNSNWRPSPTFRPGQKIQVYRYEIYAPGGIWVSETLGDLYQYPAQDEVTFVAGIAPQYIRSAQLFTATGEAGSRYVRWSRADNIIIVNGYFNPQSHPSRLLNIRTPVFDYIAENGTRTPLTISIWRPQLPRTESDSRREKRSVSDDIVDWYADRVADTDTYINAAFRSSRSNEAYLFMKNEYAIVNYAPGTTDDWVVNGPRLICDGYPSLIGTAFGEHGIDCAFDSHRGSEAFIFSGNLCAHIDYAPGTTNDKILNGPMTITAMFPFFNRTVFGNGIDAAFAAPASNEAYLFKGDHYALINYDSKTRIAIDKITEGFYCLKNTIFESGVDAAFTSDWKDQVYIFKGDQYARINFGPGSTNDYIMGGVKPVYILGGVKPLLPYWPSLCSILPRKNRGLDVHDHHNQSQADRDHDEL